MLKRFFIRLLIFVLPFAICSLASLIHAFAIGEAAPFSLVLQWQANSETPLAYQPAWSRSQFFDYKLTAIAQQEPELMVIGSSRVTFMRSAFANQNPQAFYNAGIPNMSIGEIERFIESLADGEHLPQVLIIGLDLPDYNAERGNYRRGVRNFAFPGLGEDLVWFYTGGQRVARQWFSDWSGVFSPATENYQLLGLQAYAQNEGFLWDGSRFVAQRSAESYAQNLAGDLQLFENRENHFQVGSSIDQDTITALQNLLAFAQQESIFVIGYLPPYRPSVWAQMQASGDYSYMALAKEAISASFEQANFPMYDFTDPVTIGSSEAEMTDTWHGMDYISLRIYREILRLNPDALSIYSDSAVLDSWLIEYADTPLEQFSIDLP